MASFFAFDAIANDKKDIMYGVLKRPNNYNIKAKTDVF
jgi:hypothetical protein